MVGFLIRFIIWDGTLIFGMAVSVGILGAVIESVSCTFQGGLAFASAWVAMMSSSLVLTWRFPFVQVVQI